MQDETLNSTPVPPPHSGKKLILIIGAAVVIIIIIVLVLSFVFNGNHKSNTNSTTATHSKIYKADITFGDNRSVVACNVLPQSLVTAQFGAGTEDEGASVNETIIESNVPESMIDPTNGDDAVTTCLHNLDGGGSINLTFDGYRSSESAQTAYVNDTAYSKKAKGNTVTAIPGMHATTTTYTEHRVDLEGAHNNFVYKLEVESGVVDGAATNDVLLPKAIALAKQIEANMDNPAISTHPAAIPTVSTAGGSNQIDPCQLFDAKTFEQALLAHSTVLPKLKLPKTAFPAEVERQYNTNGQAGIGDACTRHSAPAYTNESLADALKNAFTGGSENATVTLDGFTSPADAQHQVDILSDSAAEQIPNIGDIATYGQGGLEADIKQLAFSKGNYSVEITAGYGDATNTNVVPEADFVSLAKALADRLP